MFRTRLAGGPRFAAAALCVALSVSGCGKKEEPAAGGPPGAAKRPAVPVAAQKAEPRDFPVDIRAIGTVEATQSAPVRAQVNVEQRGRERMRSGARRENERRHQRECAPHPRGSAAATRTS